MMMSRGCFFSAGGGKHDTFIPLTSCGQLSVWVDSCAQNASLGQLYKMPRLNSLTFSQSHSKMKMNSLLWSSLPKWAQWKTIRRTQQKLQWKLFVYEYATGEADAAVVAEFAVCANCNHGKYPEPRRLERETRWCSPSAVTSSYRHSQLIL